MTRTHMGFLPVMIVLADMLGVVESRIDGLSGIAVMGALLAASLAGIFTWSIWVWATWEK